MREGFTERKRAHDHTYYLSHKKEAILKSKEWKKTHPKEVRLSRLKYNKTHQFERSVSHPVKGDKLRDYVYQRFYGITLDRYKEMYSNQKGRCFVCGRERSLHAKGSKRLVVEHNHKTGEIRGLVCFGCNAFITRYENDDFLNRVKKYLGVKF